MTLGAVQLREWLNRTGRTQQELADLLGVTESYVSYILSGERSPGEKMLRLLARIEVATGVPMRAWMASPVNKSRKPRKRAANKAESYQVVN